MPNFSTIGAGIGTGQDTGSSSGPVGGDLTGTLPNPTVGKVLGGKTPLAAQNNLSDVTTPATALANLAGAPLASPTFTGSPTAPTPELLDDSAALATTNAVKSAVVSQRPVANFARITYDDQNASTSVVDINQRNYSYMVLEYGGSPPGSFSDRTIIQNARTANLPIRFAAYKSAFEKAGDPAGYNSFTTPAENAANPGWYLYDSTGAKFSWGGVPQMDIGHPGYQAQAWSDAITQVKAAGYDLVFLDNAMPAPIADGSYTVNLPGTLGTLTSPLSTFAAITSLPVTTPSLAIQNGTHFTLDDGAGHTQVWYATGVAAGGNVPVQSQIPSFAFPATSTTLNSSISSDAYFAAAMRSFITYGAQQLHANGIGFIANVAGVDHPTTAQSYMDAGLDIIFEEAFGVTFSTTAAVVWATTGRVTNALANCLHATSTGKTYLVHAYVQASEQANTFGMAMFMLVADGRTAYVVDNGLTGSLSSHYIGHAVGAWDNVYDRARVLGRPLNVYYSPATNLYRRDFTNGFVLLNDSGVPITDPASNISVSSHTGLLVQYQHARTGLTYSASITPDASVGRWQSITANTNTAFTINAPTNPPLTNNTAELTIEVINTSGVAMGPITWDPVFVFAGQTWTNPATGKKRFARFEWSAASWICTSVALADY